MNNSILKRISSVVFVLLLAMTMGITSTSFAAPTQDSAIKVIGVEAGATVTAYQIVTERNGGWVTVDGATIAKVTEPKGDEITAIVNGINADPATVTPASQKSLTYDAENKSYTYTGDDLSPGLYVVLVKNSGTSDAKIYNPMIVGVDYTAENEENDQPADATKNYAFGPTAYAKSSEPNISKTANGDSGTSAAAGEEVNFTIESTIPAYSAAYKEVVYKLSDTPVKGLDKFTDVVVAPSDAVEKIEESSDGFVVTLKSNWVLENAGTKVTVTYKSKVSEDAEYNFDPNTNKAELEYSNNPSKSDDTAKKDDEANVYTFSLNGALMASQDEYKKETSEAIKTGSEELETSTRTTYEGTVTKVLNGATFKLWDNENCAEGEELQTSTTSEGGAMHFDRLKAGVTYYFKETAVPEGSGYKLDETVHTVQFEATYDPEDGKLISYKTIIDGKKAGTYSATYKMEDDVKVMDTITVGEDTQTIVNTPLPELPSTGGIGTYIFIILGALIMSIAAVAIARRSRKNEEVQ